MCFSPAESVHGERGEPKKCGVGAGCDAEKDAAFFDLLLNEVIKVNRCDHLINLLSRMSVPALIQGL